MNLKDLELGIVSYCESMVAPHIRSTLDKWIFFAGLGVLGTKLESEIQKIAPEIGLVDGDGNINIDLLEKIGLSAFEKQPKVEIWKLTFVKEDFSDFIRYLRKI